MAIGMNARWAAVAAMGILVACSDEGAGASAGASAGAAGSAAAEAGARASVDASATADARVDRDAAAPRHHARCGWIGAADANGVATFVAHAAFFDAVHPDWYALATDGVSFKTIAGEGDAALLDAARAHGVLVQPMIAAVDGGDADRLRAMFADSGKRAQHIASLVALATSKGYSGLDLDYEHMWQASDRPLYTTFIREAAKAMHAAGKELSIAVPALADAAGANAWDYDALSQALDTLHVMGYDYHSIGTHPGPTAPLGWIDAVSAHAAATGRGDKFVLGVPNYGTTPTWYGTLSECLAACNGSYATQTTEMESCAYNVDTHYAAGRALSCASAHGSLFFDDTASLEEKVKAAKAHGLRGITYWTIGGEPAGFFEMVQRYF